MLYRFGLMQHDVPWKAGAKGDGLFSSVHIFFDTVAIFAAASLCEVLFFDSYCILPFRRAAMLGCPILFPAESAVIFVCIDLRYSLFSSCRSFLSIMLLLNFDISGSSCFFFFGIAVILQGY